VAQNVFLPSPGAPFIDQRALAERFASWRPTPASP
jgi:hypothetical protein